MCAAPGGKTTAIAILMKDKGEVIAVDRSHNKVHLLNLIGDCAHLNFFIISSLHYQNTFSYFKIDQMAWKLIYIAGGLLS